MSPSKSRKADSKKHKRAKTAPSSKRAYSPHPTTPEGVFDEAIRYRSDKALTPEQTVDFQSIVKAWSAFVANNDDEMSATLKTIGTKSLALDWKLLLRGFAAYAKSDDERAIENWRRVNATRPCGKIAGAALALVSDDAAATGSSSWKRVATMLQNDLLLGLAEIAHDLQQTHDLEHAIRIIKQRRTLFQASGLLEPLSNILYHAIYNDGQPRDVLAYLKVLPQPKYDPEFLLMTGLILTRVGQLSEASECLERYADWLKQNAHGWPADVHRRALAKVMVERANLQLAAGEQPHPFAFLGFDSPKSVSDNNILPIMKQAQASAPDWDDLTLWLIRELPRTNESKLATELGQAYLATHPDTGPICHAVGVAHGTLGNWATAVQFYARASAADPLNKSTQRTVGWAAVIAALRHLLNNNDAEAEAMLADYDSYIEDQFAAASTTIRAAIALRRNDLDALESLTESLQQDSGDKIVFVYLWGVLATQLKFKPKFKKPATDAMAALWKAFKPSHHDAGLLLFTTWRFIVFAGIDYRGSKTHQKSALTAMDADKTALTPEILSGLVNEFIRHRRVDEAEAMVKIVKKSVVKAVTSYFLAVIEEAKHPNTSDPEKISRFLDDAEHSLYRAGKYVQAWLEPHIAHFPRRNPLNFSQFYKTVQSLSMNADPYAVLDVPRDADDAAIRTAYMQKVRQFPPESHGTEFAHVRQAYECLKELDARADLWLFEQGLLDSPESLMKSVLTKLPRARLKLDNVAKALD